MLGQMQGGEDEAYVQKGQLLEKQEDEQSREYRQVKHLVMSG